MFDDDEEFALAADEGVVDETSEQDEQEIQKNANLMLNMTLVRIFLQCLYSSDFILSSASDALIKA